MAFSISALRSAFDFSIFAQCARGNCQLAIYEYIAGFFATSAVCAPEGIAHKATINNAHNPVKTRNFYMFIVFLLL